LPLKNRYAAKIRTRRKMNPRTLATITPISWPLVSLLPPVPVGFGVIVGIAVVDDDDVDITGDEVGDEVVDGRLKEEVVDGRLKEEVVDGRLKEVVVEGVVIGVAEDVVEGIADVVEVVDVEGGGVKPP
jgi:hypothetical protein